MVRTRPLAHNNRSSAPATTTTTRTPTTTKTTKSPIHGSNQHDQLHPKYRNSNTTSNDTTTNDNDYCTTATSNNREKSNDRRQQRQQQQQQRRQQLSGNNNTNNNNHSLPNSLYDDNYYFDVCIIGAGPAGLACLSAIRESYSVDTLTEGQVQRALRFTQNKKQQQQQQQQPRNGAQQQEHHHQQSQSGGSSFLSVVVIDPSPQWLHDWHQNMNILQIQYLRSPALAHPDLFDSHALLAYAMTQNNNKMPTAPSFHVAGASTFTTPTTTTTTQQQQQQQQKKMKRCRRRKDTTPPNDDDGDDDAHHHPRQQRKRQPQQPLVLPPHPPIRKTVHADDVDDDEDQAGTEENHHPSEDDHHELLLESGCVDLKTLRGLGGQTQVGLWKLPSTRLFRDFCTNLVNRLQPHTYYQGHVVTIHEDRKPYDDTVSPLHQDQQQQPAPRGSWFRITWQAVLGKEDETMGNNIAHHHRHDQEHPYDDGTPITGERSISSSDGHRLSKTKILWARHVIVATGLQGKVVVPGKLDSCPHARLWNDPQAFPPPIVQRRKARTKTATTKRTTTTTGKATTNAAVAGRRRRTTQSSSSTTTRTKSTSSSSPSPLFLSTPTCISTEMTITGGADDDAVDRPRSNSSWHGQEHASSHLSEQQQSPVTTQTSLPPPPYLSSTSSFTTTRTIATTNNISTPFSASTTSSTSTVMPTADDDDDDNNRPSSRHGPYHQSHFSVQEPHRTTAPTASSLSPLPPPKVGRERVLVVGGGLTAVQAALRVIDEGHLCTLCSRRPFQERHFDIPVEWFDLRKTNKCFADKIYHQSTNEERLQQLREARDGGSVPPLYLRRLEKVAAAAALLLCSSNNDNDVPTHSSQPQKQQPPPPHYYEEGELDDYSRPPLTCWVGPVEYIVPDNNHIHNNDDRDNDHNDNSPVPRNTRPRCSSSSNSSSSSPNDSRRCYAVQVCYQGSLHEFDRVILACGVQPDCTQHPLLLHLLQQWPIPVYGGFPLLTPDLQWPRNSNDNNKNNTCGNGSGSHGPVDNRHNNQDGGSNATTSSWSSCAASSAGLGDDNNKDRHEEDDNGNNHIFVVGAMAAWQVGPDAGNLMGMRRAAQLVANRLNCRSWLRETALVNPFTALLESSSSSSSEDDGNDDDNSDDSETEE